MNTVPKEIQDALDSKQYIVEGEKHRFIIRSLLDENERITKERDHWQQMYKIAKEEWEQVKKELEQARKGVGANE